MPWRTCGGQLVGVGFPLLSWEVPGSLRSLCLWQVPLPVETSHGPLGFPWVLSVVSKNGLGSLMEPEYSENPSSAPLPPMTPLSLWRRLPTAHSSFPPIEPPWVPVLRSPLLFKHLRVTLAIGVG